MIVLHTSSFYFSSHFSCLSVPSGLSSSLDVTGNSESNSSALTVVTSECSNSVTSCSSVVSSSHMPPLLRQDTFSMSKITKSLRSLSDEANPLDTSLSLRTLTSLLESDEAKLTPESLDKLKTNKSVAKIASKMEKELSLLQRKHEKVKEREILTITSKEGKIIKQQTALASKKSALKSQLSSQFTCANSTVTSSLLHDAR